MVFAVARECKLARATLYGYVVMPHHVHLIVRPRETMNGPEFMKVFKKESGEAIVKLLSEAELRQFDQQRGLNGNTFWKYSFRSVIIDGKRMFWEKMHYIHMNPVKAGYVESPEDYRWSSARLVLEGKMSRETGLDYSAVVGCLGTGGEEPPGSSGSRTSLPYKARDREELRANRKTSLTNRMARSPTFPNLLA